MYAGAVREDRYDSPACYLLLRAALYLANKYPPEFRPMVGGGKAYARSQDVDDALSLLYALRCVVSYSSEGRG